MTPFAAGTDVADHLVCGAALYNLQLVEALPESCTPAVC